jgi:hypothetical protein
MNAGVILVLWVTFFVLCPVLDIGGHFIYPPELFIYLAFAARLLFARRGAGVPESGGAPLRGAVRAHVAYFALFLATVLWTASLVDQSLNNYDVYILRHVLQVLMCLYLFGDKLRSIAESPRFDRVIFVVVIVLCLPAVIVYLQRLDLFSTRALITALYKPQFFFLEQKSFASFRYTSVFKDFFTAAVYFTMLASFIFFFTLRTRLGGAYRAVLVLLLALVYGAQLFVARSSLVAIPVLIGATALYAARLDVRYLFGRLVPMATFVVAAGVIGSQYLLESGLVNAKWTGEALAFVDESTRTKSDSATVMQEWNESFYRRMEKNDLLWEPHHAYDLTEQKNPGLYTDSFYGQEIYRYGIYGLVAYAVYLALMLGAHWRANRYVFLLVLALAVLNIKGGDTFFMPKVIYLYAFVLAASAYLEKRSAT